MGNFGSYPQNDYNNINQKLKIFIQINQKSVKKTWKFPMVFTIFDLSNKQKMSARIQNLGQKKFLSVS